MNRHHARISTILLLLLCAAATQLPAANIIVTSSSSPDGSSPRTFAITQRTGDVAVDAETGIETWVGSFNSSSFNMEWDLWFDADPGVGGTVLFTNPNSSTSTYSIDFGVDSSIALPAGSPMVGSSSITVADSNSSGTTAAMSALVGGAIYAAKINGVTQGTLFPVNPATMSYNLPAPGNGTSFDIGAFPSGSTTNTAIPINGELSLTHAFRLTGGDSATVLSTFVVVPSPTGFVLVWLGVLGLCFCRRKRILQ